MEHKAIPLRWILLLPSVFHKRKSPLIYTLSNLLVGLCYSIIHYNQLLKHLDLLILNLPKSSVKMISNRLRNYKSDLSWVFIMKITTILAFLEHAPFTQGSLVVPAVVSVPSGDTHTKLCPCHRRPDPDCRMGSQSRT